VILETEMHQSLLSVFVLSSHWSSVDMELWSVQEQIVSTQLYIKTNMITTVQCVYQKLTFITQSFSRGFLSHGAAWRPEMSCPHPWLNAANFTSAWSNP